MPKQQLALDPGGPKRLVISWKGLWKNATVTLDGQVLGSFPNKAALQAGQEFFLPDGSALHVQLVSKPYQVELRVLRNGQPLPGSASDPASKLKVAYGVIFFVAALNVLLGAIALATESAFMQAVGIGPSSMIFGVVFLLLGIFVMKRSLVALIVAIVLFSADAVITFALVVSAGGQPAIGGIIFRAFLIYGMAQGIGAIRALRVADAVPPAVAYPPPPGMGGPSAAPTGAAPADPDNPYRR